MAKFEDAIVVHRIKGVIAQIFVHTWFSSLPSAQIFGNDDSYTGKPPR
jgi:hypothetical protein